MFENFQWPEPEEEADEKLIRNVREHGCHVLNVHDHPPFILFDWPRAQLRASRDRDF